MVGHRGRGRGGTDIDDAPPAALDHGRQAGANHAKRARQVDVDDVQPGLLIVTADKLVCGHTRRIDQNVGGPVLGLERGSKAFDALYLRDIQNLMEKPVGDTL